MSDRKDEAFTSIFGHDRRPPVRQQPSVDDYARPPQPADYARQPPYPQAHHTQSAQYPPRVRSGYISPAGSMSPQPSYAQYQQHPQQPRWQPAQSAVIEDTNAYYPPQPPPPQQHQQMQQQHQQAYPPPRQASFHHQQPERKSSQHEPNYPAQLTNVAGVRPHRDMYEMPTTRMGNSAPATASRQDPERAQSLQSYVTRPNLGAPRHTGTSAAAVARASSGANNYFVPHAPEAPLPDVNGQTAALQPARRLPPTPSNADVSPGGRAPTLPPIDQLYVQRPLQHDHSPGRADTESLTSTYLPSRSASNATSITKGPDRTYSMSSVGTKNAPDRAFSFSSGTTEKRPSYASQKSNHQHSGSGQAIYTTSKRAPIVYPALLSRVADAFRQRIVLGEKAKDGLSYKDAFLGSEAVDIIAYIIRTTDRNLALLLGRALDAQKFIHDVTYDHRLRDSSQDVYQFKETMGIGFTQEEQQNGMLSTHSSISQRKRPSRAPTIDSVDSTLIDSTRDGTVLHSGDYEDDLPNGVFTLLTECYSPTCTRERLCYSIACPRRLEQQARLNMRLSPGLKRAESRGSLTDAADGQQENKLWINTVSQEVVNSVDEQEKKRQEIICEAIYTERDFVKDLEYLRDFWIKPLRTSPCIPEARKDKFIRTVFSNVLEVHSVNSRLAEALTHRQNAQAVVHEVGDVFLEFVPHFDPFIRYGAQQLLAKFEFEKEKSTNPAFAKFVEETERLKESRKLELNGYLTKPTTRLARYPLLLEAVLKQTKDNNPDKVNIPKAVAAIKVFLSRVNAESGKAENRFNLMQLQAQLVSKPGEQDFQNLKLSDESRQLIYRGPLKKKNVGGSSSAAGADAASDIQVFLFDHALLMAKAKTVNKRELLRIHRKPVPLELLVLQRAEDELKEAAKSSNSIAKRPSSSLLPGAGKSSMSLPGRASDNTKGYSITFQHLGRRGYVLTLFATSLISRKKWIETIEQQQRLLRERSSIFQRVTVCEKYFLGSNKVQCVVPYDGGRKLIYGTDNGIYVSDRRPGSATRSTPVRVLAIQGATQIDIIEEYGILLVLQDKTLVSFSMEALDVNDNNITNKRPKKVSSHASFFKAGICLGRVLVCVVKSSVLSSTIKVFEPVDHRGLGKKQPAFRKLLAGGNDLKVFKEFYIPTESSSIHFLKSKLCVGCAKGFEVVSLENLETQSLLDPADSSLDYFQKREGVRPVAIYRLNGEFLLCYDEFAFFVDRHGWRARPNWCIQWEGICEATALHYPYILAFEPSFVEIYHVETAQRVQIIPGNHIRLLHEGRGKMGEGGEILFVSDGGPLDVAGQTIAAAAGDSVVSALSLRNNNISIQPNQQNGHPLPPQQYTPHPGHQQQRSSRISQLE
ncbi:RHO1 GDP-GTP exchange protein 2 [Savitreella phatthalungensis]